METFKADFNLKEKAHQLNHIMLKIFPFNHKFKDIVDNS